MGERRPNDTHQKDAQMCEYKAHMALMLGRTILGERMWDVSKAIDALSEFSVCDTDKILITGNSGGRTISLYASVYDERIKLSAPSCAFCMYRTVERIYEEAGVPDNCRLVVTTKGTLLVRGYNVG